MLLLLMRWGAQGGGRGCSQALQRRRACARGRRRGGCCRVQAAPRRSGCGVKAPRRRSSSGGLLTGTENRGRGIAYNALRLARTELQFANHTVTTKDVVYGYFI